MSGGEAEGDATEAEEAHAEVTGGVVEEGEG